ncbi:MAG TPA: cation-transporting P-type ATPase, partial [Polyangiaceae bacterium]|nr:cation-transporting P-type ATPase [Polyangiaceae bacterium]
LTRRRRAPRRSALFDLATAVSDELFNPLTPLLAAGAALSAVVGSLTDAVMVGGVVALNAGVGGFQRFQIDRAIAELGQSTRVKVHVRRDGMVRELASDELVRGDVLLLSAGDLIPADCRIIESTLLEVDASGLTGESLPVPRSATPSFEEGVSDRSSMLYAGTVVSSGQTVCVVVATGDETEARRGAAFRGHVRESGVEKRMRELMDWTAPLAAVAGVGVIGAGLLRGRKLEELVGSAVSLAVASVPEGLPLLATAAQLAAARRLRVHGAYVRNVRALEALGRVDTLCVDKTGTVTEGAISLGLLSDGHGSEQVTRDAKYTGERPYPAVLAASLRASPPRPGDLERADPLEVALWRSAEMLAITPLHDRPNWQRSAEIPFDASRGYHAVLGESDAGRTISVKGAPEVLLAVCRSSEAERARLAAMVDELATGGYRVLCVAERATDDPELQPEAVRDLDFVGFLAFRDTVRPTARQALAELRRAGLRPVMVTGDHPSTAQAIFRELGLAEQPEVLTGAELAALSEEQLAERSPLVDVFARVSPSQKVRVVRALQRAGRTVAMVGDGSNDAPAIRLASVGVAMGDRSSEAARNAADIVLGDARIETLVHAIVEGRSVWDSVRDAVAILVGGNMGEIGFTLLGGLVSGRPPLSPRQLLLVNLFTDVAPATALALRAPSATDLDQLVEAGPEASLGKQLQRDIAARAITTATGAGLAWGIGSVIGSRRSASTMALLALVGTQLGQTLSSGERSRQVVMTSVLTALGLGLIVQTPGVSGAFGCRPLGPIGWSVALGSSVAATVGGRYAPEWLDRWRDERERRARGEPPTPWVELLAPGAPPVAAFA